MATHARSADNPKKRTLIAALAQVGDPRAAALIADYPVRNAVAAAKNPNVIRQVEDLRFHSFANDLVPRALHVISETLKGEPSRARDEMARWVVKEWKEEHAQLENAADEEDSGLSGDALAKKIADLELQRAAFEAIAAGRATDVTPSQDSIDDADTITDIDPFG
jgi:hypothetical protein